jgi:hypothetical protein
MSIRAKLIALVLLLGMTGYGAPVFAQNRPGQPPQFQQNRNQQKANADDAAAVAGGVMCVGGVVILLGIALKIGIILFIVSDAKKRGMDPTMWVILEIFVGLIGLIVYLCVREPLLSEKRRRRMRDDEDDDYDRPRRSRRVRDRDDDDDYERPRRSQSSRDDNDDYDRPRESRRKRPEDDGKNPFDFN